MSNYHYLLMLEEYGRKLTSDETPLMSLIYQDDDESFKTKTHTEQRPLS